MQLSAVPENPRPQRTDSSILGHDHIDFMAIACRKICKKEKSRNLGSVAQNVTGGGSHDEGNDLPGGSMQLLAGNTGRNPTEEARRVPRGVAGRARAAISRLVLNTSHGVICSARPIVKFNPQLDDVVVLCGEGEILKRV